MREYDTEIVVLQVVDVLAKRAAREKLLEKRRADARYPLDVALPASRSKSDTDEFDSLDLRIYGLDMSYHGIGFLADQPLAPNSKLRISLQPLGLAGISILARVIYCRRLLDGVYRFGAEFLHQQILVRNGERIVHAADGE